MLFTDEHELVRKSLRSFIDREIDPHVDEWEEARSSPPTRCSRSSATRASSA
jgi:alkylation response protein AidB-like acyl-CoA dehydrogenase